MSLTITFSCPRREYAEEGTADFGKPVEGPTITGLEYVQAVYGNIETTDGLRIASLSTVTGDWEMEWPGHKGESYSDFTVWNG